MSRRCELTGKGVMTGNRVSHAVNRTRRRSVKLRISANALRTVEHRGGIDAFLIKQDDADLSDRAKALKQEVRAALATAAQ